MLKYQQPDASGHFGPYGGSFVAETLVHALDELKRRYAEVQHDAAFMAEYRHELAHFVGPYYDAGHAIPGHPAALDWLPGTSPLPT